MHDGHADRTTDGKGMIEGMAFEDFKKLTLKRSQERAPSAADVFAAFKGYDDFFIEIEMKAYPSEFYTPEVLEDYCRKLNELARASLPEGTYAFTCFNTNTLATMRRVDERAPLGYIMWQPEDWQIGVAKELRCCCIAPGLPVTDRAFVDRAHAAGLLVCLWMVQDVPAYVEAKAKGADRITSDYPVALMQSLASASSERLKSPFKLSVESDRLDGLYTVGETASFRLSAKNSAGELVKEGIVTVNLGDFSDPACSQVTADFSKSNPFVIEASLNQPGFLRLQANECVYGVGFSVDRLTAPGAVGSDVGGWANSLAAFDRSVKTRPTSVEDAVLSDAGWVVERVNFAAINGERLFGWLSKPRDAKGLLPGRVVFVDAASESVRPVKVPGRVALVISTDEQLKRPSIFIAHRLINWLAQRGDVDATKLDCFGFGKGAAQALAALALEPSLKRGAILSPDFRQNAGIAADYARLMKSPVRFCLGYADDMVSPEMAYSVYNACGSKDKAMLGGMGMGHEVFADYYDYVEAWSRGSELSKSAYRFLAFNIWGDYFGNPVGERVDEIISTVRDWNPDIAGFQETTQRFWDSKLISELGRDYGIVGRGIGYQGRNVHTPLLYRKSRFDLVDSGIVLYCPELDDSKGALWAVLTDKTTGKKLVAFASHAWWRTDGQADSWIRLHGSMMLHAKMTELAKKYDAAVIGGGDLNAPMSSQSLKYLVEHGYADAQATAEFSPRRFPTEHGDPVRISEAPTSAAMAQRAIVSSASVRATSTISSTTRRSSW